MTSTPTIYGQRIGDVVTGFRYAKPEWRIIAADLCMLEQALNMALTDMYSDEGQFGIAKLKADAHDARLADLTVQIVADSVDEAVTQFVYVIDLEKGLIM